MAQVVGFFDDHVSYTEGPFVVGLSALGGSPRTEVQRPGSGTPVIPHSSVMAYVAKLKEEQVLRSCSERVDYLNQLVREGKIVLDGEVWVLPEMPETPKVRPDFSLA